MNIKVGSKVTYVTPHKTECGIVKSIPDDDYAFVVYHCAGNWDDYENYTAARTRIADLELGWKEV